MIEINEVSREAGDIAIIEAMKKMEDSSNEDDVVFRIGGGGQPHYAQAGGKNKDGLSAAVDKVVELAQL